ncbi:MAG TPA: efflux RND transporter periplasmic adaptor subunit [Acetobacteraceae bacterium]|nr:efflux RND transporter periplasmic adaptor subunit [Acetobacteraceae bacterium]
MSHRLSWLPLALLLVLPVAARAQPAVPVQAAEAKRQDVPVVLRNIGAVQAFYSVLVRARVDGTLDRVFFTEGQEVKAGDPIALIDPRPYQAALDAAVAKKAADEAMLANARADLTRYANLARKDFASRQQVDTQQATVAQMQATIAGDDAAIETARLNLQFCHITSPITGRTGLRLVDPGNLIHASDAQGIVTITQLHPIAVVFTLPQDDLPQVQAAMARGAATVLAYTGDDHTDLARGRLMTIDNQIDQSTGTIKLKAEFANPDNRLWPGLFVNAHLQVDVLKGVVTVPSTALQRGPNGLYVYRVKSDATVAMQPVKVTQDDGEAAVIADGVAAGETVVVNGQLRLQNGSHVAVAKAGS